VKGRTKPIKSSNLPVEPVPSMRSWLLIWCILTLPVCVAAQRTSYSFRTITINQGLSQNSVIDVATDDLGFVWLATQDGLNRYDGKEFVSFRKAFDDITTSAYSRLGKIIRGSGHYLWLITSGGKLEQFNLYNDSTIAFTNLPGGIKLPAVSCLLPGEKGSLWIGTETQGLYYYDSAARTTIHYTKSGNASTRLNSDSIQHIFLSSNRQCWVLTNNGINVITPGAAQTTRWLYQSSGPTISCSVMEEDTTGTLWVGTYAKGLYLKRVTDTAFTPFTGFDKDNALPPQLVVQAIRKDAQGCIWVGSLGKGLYIINPKAATVKSLKPDPRNPFSISYKDILCIQPGKQGGMWIGTDGNGVNYYDKRLNIFTLLSKNTLPENVPIEQVRSITTDVDGGIWIGTSYSGLSWSPDVRDNNAYKTILPRGDSSQVRIMSLLADQKDIWVGVMDNGLQLLDRKTRQLKDFFSPQGKGRFYLPDNTIWCMQTINNERAWLGTRNAGLCLFDKQQGLIKNYQYNPAAPDGIADNNIRSLIAINDSVLCLGFEDKGVQFFNTRSVQFFFPPHDQPFKQFSASAPTLKCLYYQYPLLWVGTLGKGIFVFDLASGKTFTINDRNGLPNNTIYSIVKDKQGDLWMSTNKGICCFRKPADLQTTNRSYFSLFTAEDGLQSNEFNTGAYHVDANGMLYFGGINGLNWFTPFMIAAPSAPIVVTNATVNNEPWKSDTGITYKRILELPYDQNSLSFNFAALDFVSPGKFNYYYQLANYDKDWIDAGNRNYAAYTNLPPGKYIFRVRAAGQLVANNNDMPPLYIIITPPFWKTWWFMTLCVLALGAFLYGLYRYRINQLIALQKVRNRIATDLHDDIGSTLTNISILSELSRKKLPEQEEAQVFLGRIAEEVSNSSQALDDIVWSINTNNDTLEQTVARMRRYAAEIFDGANIHYTLHLDEQFAQRKLNMEQRRDCFLLYKEAINNIYKHAHATTVSIRVWLDRGQLFMTVQDDGKGFDTSIITHRNGLKNMQQRVKRWQGSIEIQSAPGKGTYTAIRLQVR
jgi:ligand-binding sensor domain-containing protein/two-component sensor histidine kinase